ncbi:MAG: hypothetical protein ACRELB_09295 [Polyangiaceae bacterium]
MLDLLVFQLELTAVKAAEEPVAVVAAPVGGRSGRGKKPRPDDRIADDCTGTAGFWGLADDPSPGGGPGAKRLECKRYA